MTYQPVIGLEVHAYVKTHTKMFCASRNDPNEMHPNTNVCPVCLGHPGTLPTINAAAVEAVVRMGLALGCTIAQETWFERKNYFYPDLPKGFQISQYERPLCAKGTFCGVGIRRIHLEEDAGRLVHASDGSTLVDFNRAGTPLMELVTEPDIRSAEEARRFAEELQLLLRYAGVSDADMEKGQMRVEVNISLAPERKTSQDEHSLGTKVEIKNLNSFRAVEQAIAAEIERQSALLEQGKAVVHETRGWDAQTQRTLSQRTKETSEDYRYFPEPDLPPFSVAALFDIEALRSALPEMPQARRARFTTEYGLPKQDIEILVREKAMGELFETTASELRAWETTVHGSGQEGRRHLPDLYTRAANVLITRVVGIVGTSADEDIGALRATPEQLAHLVILLHDGAISSTAGDVVLRAMLETGRDPVEIVQERNLAQVSDAEALRPIVEAVIARNADAAADFRAGNANAIQFLVGKVMKESAGKADPAVARVMLEKLL